MPLTPLTALRTHGLAPSGEAVARTAAGVVVFVPHALADEEVEVELVHQRKTFARGRLVRVLKPSPQRVAPVCPHFGACGGCQLQHLDYAAQVAFKTQAVREQLTRIGKLDVPEVRDCVPSPKPWHYRNRIQLVASPSGRLGYYAAHSHAVVEIDACPIAHEKLNELLHEATHNRNADLRVSVHTGEILKIGDWRLATAQQSLNLQSQFSERIGAHTYTVSAQSFFQVNSYVAALLVNEVLAALAVQPNDAVLDLFCGAGLFTLPISLRAGAVLGVENNASAVADARVNLRGCSNARLLLADVGHALHQKEITHQRWDAVVLDPPRAGVAREALAKLAQLHVPKLVYVSCDPATLARDLKFLCANGYTLRYAQPLDMFPQTHHVETVAVLAATGNTNAEQRLSSG
jgi:23S rRNA (uracil1939-C5)-methyltransferase